MKRTHDPSDIRPSKRGPTRKKRDATDAPGSGRAAEANTVRPQILRKVISGGQTGADWGALDAAKSLGIPTGGTAPPRFLTSVGPRPELGSHYGLVELECSASMKRKAGACYAARTRVNADDSDGTLALRYHPGRGTDMTIAYCLTKKWKKVDEELWSSYSDVYRPVLVLRDGLDPDASITEEERRAMWEANAQQLWDFLVRHGIEVLNVAGHRSAGPSCRFQDTVREFLTFAFGYVIERRRDGTATDGAAEHTL